MRWYPVAALQYFIGQAGVRSYRLLYGTRRYALVIVRRDPPTVDLSREPGK